MLTNSRERLSPLQSAIASARIFSRLLAAVALVPLSATSSLTASVVSVDQQDDTPGSDQRWSFEKDILPLFQSKCSECHNAQLRKGELDLTSWDSVRAGGESGAVLIAGDIEKSHLWQLIEKGEMPPAGSPNLASEEIDRIRKWIQDGAYSAMGSQAFDLPQSLNQHDILPITLRHCVVCHGIHRQEGGLDLSSPESILRGGKSGPAIDLHRPANSRLLHRIEQGEMPPQERLVEVSVKPVDPSDLDKLRRWIETGAKVEPTSLSEESEVGQSSETNDFWAFQTPAHPPIPKVLPVDPVGDSRSDAFVTDNPIDAFVLAKLRDHGMGFSQEADKCTLIRRVSIDLIGLPPEPGELADFLADDSPNAYERLVDRLLASPSYGERSAREWLDLAGYSDSEGKREQDLPRPHAWRYRDYVIRSFNQDKPFDRFLIEQLAGDELQDYESGGAITPEIYDNLVATGFLRMAPDPTWANITGYVPDRLDVISDEMDILGSGVLGLTLKCARCHSHKFDPISQRDYYRLIDLFKGAYDEYDWLKPDVRPGIGPVSQDFGKGRLLPFVTTEERMAWQANEDRIAKEIEEAQRLPENEAMIQRLKSQRRPEPQIQALWDRGNPSPTYLYRRGDPLSPGPLVQAGVPAFLNHASIPFEIKAPWPGAKSTGRRLAFARWLTHPSHPLTARVAVNRIWKHHFGTGIVRSVGNFGVAGERPTHPELLDWLATSYVRNGWSTKWVHRLIVTSRTYRQSSKPSPDIAAFNSHDANSHDANSGNPASASSLYGQMSIKRLDAESIYDAMLAVADRLNLSPFGPADPLDAQSDGLITPRSNSGAWRRLIYVSQQRKQLATHLETFDFPQMNPNCLERKDSLVATQALHLLNNGMVFRLAEEFANRVRRDFGDDARRQIEGAFLLSISRYPSPEELDASLQGLDRLSQRWREVDGDDSAANELSKRKALVEFCHALLNSAAFLFVD